MVAGPTISEQLAPSEPTWIRITSQRVSANLPVFGNSAKPLATLCVWIWAVDVIPVVVRAEHRFGLTAVALDIEETNAGAFPAGKRLASEQLQSYQNFAGAAASRHTIRPSNLESQRPFLTARRGYDLHAILRGCLRSAVQLPIEVGNEAETMAFVRWSSGARRNVRPAAAASTSALAAF